MNNNRNKICKYLLCALISFFVLGTTSLQAGVVSETEEFNTIIDRVVEIQKTKIGVTTVDNDITARKALIVNGAFADIDYTNKAQTNWPAANHLLRLRNYATAYVHPKSAYYKSTELYNLLVDGLEFWLGTKPTSSNWWYNQIDTGQKLGLLLVLMESGDTKFSADLVQRATTYMKNNCGTPASIPGGGKGANQIDLATHWLYRGIVLRDATLTKTAADYIFEPTQLDVIDDGIQHDYSYAAHSFQLYIGGYGDVYVDGTLYATTVLRDTSFGIDPANLDVLHNFMKETYFSVIRGRYRLYNVLGRSLTRTATSTLFVKIFADKARQMKDIYPQESEFYDDVIARLEDNSKTASYKVEPANRHFWRTDYTLHRRPDYTIDTRLVSIRTTRNETLNSENLKGYFLSDGGMAIVVDGGEYSQIVAAWDWSKIPGTTIPSYPKAKIPSQSYSYGRTSFAGGVSDAKYAATGYIYNDLFANINTSARKGWFYFDNEVVCLGAGINSTNEYDVATTINQTLTNSKSVNVATLGQTVVAPDGVTTYENPKWIQHSKVAYFFPNPSETNLVIDKGDKSGNWKDINTSNASLIDTKNIFAAWIDHGNQPKDGTYSYIIVPNIKTVAEANSYNMANIEILSNTSEIQAVRHKSLNILQVIFFEAGKLDIDNGATSIGVDRPCVLMLKGIGTPNVILDVADPMQTATKIEIITKLPLIGNKITVVDGLSTYSSNKSQSGITNTFVVDVNSKDVEKPLVPLKTIETTAIEDTYVVSGGNANVNFGSEERLVIKSNFTREALLKFSLDDVKAELALGGDKMVGASEILLTVRTANSSANTIPLVCKLAGNNWSESSVTWNTKPVMSLEVLSSVMGKAAPAVLHFDVTEALKEAVMNNESEISFYILQEEVSSDGKHDIQIQSREFANPENRPLLNIGIFSSGIVGVEDNKLDDLLILKLCPTIVNSGEKIMIECDEDIDYNVFDMSGRLISSVQGQVIETAGLASGVYFVKGINNKQQTTAKFIVK